MLTRRALRTLSTAHGTQREMRDVEIWRKTQHTCFIFLHSFFVFYKFWNSFQFIHGLNLDLYVTLISFFLLLAIPPKSLFLGLKDFRRNRKGKERKKKKDDWCEIERFLTRRDTNLFCFLCYKFEQIKD